MNADSPRNSHTQVVLVFKGDYTLEKTLPADVVSFDAIGLGEICPGCTVNNYAAQGYLEAVAATNNFEKARAKWEETGLWWSVTGRECRGTTARRRVRVL